MSLLACLLLAATAAPPSATEAPSARVARLVASIDAGRIAATVARLAEFGTRHTLSDAASPTRGIGAARRWLEGEFAALGRAPASRLRPFEDRFVAERSPRIPRPTEIVNVGAVLPGADAARSKEAVVVTAHYDSRASDVMDASAEAPGANDDASGVAIVLELARALSRERPAVSIYLVAVAGEEQGLVGSSHLARRLREQGVDVLAMTSIDIAGNTHGQDGVSEDVTARLFSEGVPAAETPERAMLREALGAENDSPAREWARYVKRTAERYVENLDLWVMLRQDRIGRGSDHTSFAREGYPAIRLSETHEHWDRQHQDPRTVGGRAYGDDVAHVDAAYSAKLARGLLAAVAHLAAAPAPVRDVSIGGGSPDARLRFALPDDRRVAGVVVYRRRADGVVWERAVRGPRTGALVLEGVVPDNVVLAVATVDSEGNESLPAHPARIQ